MADNFVFRRGTGSKQKDKNLLEISEEFIALQNQREDALVISFMAPVDDITNIHDYFDNMGELEPVTLEIAEAGEVEYYFRGISPVEDIEDGVQKLSITLQLRREFL